LPNLFPEPQLLYKPADLASREFHLLYKDCRRERVLYR